MAQLGIDVGGTNTDAVVVDDGRVVAKTKTFTTADVTTGIRTALAEIVVRAGPNIHDVNAVMIGTTHFTNAVVQRRHLNRVAAIRVSLPASASLRPFCDWPPDLASVVNGGTYLVHGGHEYDGRPIVPMDEQAVAQAAREIRANGINKVAISATFSPLTAQCETRAAEIVGNEHPDAHVTLSSALGRIGLLERENVALLNAALIDLAGSITNALKVAVTETGLIADLYITQNDGTVSRAETARNYPVFSFASGPTNSMRGAALLAGISDAMVCDVGGTTTDVGCLINGFPREANSTVQIGGVRTLFRMPDLLSIGIGGGTEVSDDGHTIGPGSVGYRLGSEALVFGGNSLTLTDIAVANGLLEIGESTRVQQLDPDFCRQVLRAAQDQIVEAVDRMKTDAAPIPLLAVGGGAMLIPPSMAGISRVIRVEHDSVANAVGAAIAQISGETDRIYRDTTREAAIALARDEAIEKAVDSGASRPTVRVIDVEDLPLSYLPGNAVRVRVRVVGDA